MLSGADTDLLTWLYWLYTGFKGIFWHAFDTVTCPKLSLKRQVASKEVCRRRHSSLLQDLTQTCQAKSLGISR